MQLPRCYTLRHHVSSLIWVEFHIEDLHLIQLCICVSYGDSTQWKAYFACLLTPCGTAATQWLRYFATNLKVAGSIPAGVIKSFRSHYNPGVDSASNRNEYQEHFLGVKAAGVWGWQPYHYPVPFIMKSGNINFLEPSGPLQACKGTALTFSF